MKSKKHKMTSIMLKTVILLLIAVSVRAEFFAGGYFNWWILYLFTTQSNILVFFITLWLLTSKKGAGSSFGAVLVGTVLLAITLTGLVYTTVIYPLWHYEAFWLTAEYSWSRIATHMAVPILFIGNWIFFEAHGACRWRHLLLWVIYPASYGLLMLKKGLLMYQFMSQVAGLAFVFCLFLLIGGIYVKVDHSLAKMRSY